MPKPAYCRAIAGFVLGEPRRWHPLAGFGNLAQTLERRLNLGLGPVPARILGLIAWLVLLLPPVALAWALCQLEYGWVAHLLLLYFAIGARSLKEHAMAIYQHCCAGIYPPRAMP